ncbi:hypothetical protein J6590_083695 [Homalodisca vitripennis]|nr:hypothetical protein J6590_083695 [Homalodisca vitripennis]
MVNARQAELATLVDKDGQEEPARISNEIHRHWLRLRKESNSCSRKEITNETTHHPLIYVS